MEWYWLLVILVTHYIADFWVQTHQQSIDKSSKLDALTAHVMSYTMCFLVPILVIEFTGEEYHWVESSIALVAIFAGHWITDFVTSRIAKKYFSRPNGIGVRQGFQVVGIDQMIHYIHLYLVFNWLLC